MMAKIQAMLRRTYDMGGKIPVLEHRGAVLNLNDATLIYQDKQLDLTKNEFRILQTLLEQKGKIVSRDTLMTRLWQMDCYVEENTLTVNVTRLRKKLDSIGLTGFIRTKVGSGYLIELKEVQQMQQEKGIQVLWHFLWEQRFHMFLFLLFIVLFVVVFSLYDLELEAIWYSSLLCLVSAVLFQSVRFIQYYRRHRRRQALLHHITLSYDDLPAPSTLTEQDTQEMVHTLGKTYHDAMAACKYSKKKLWITIVHGYTKSKRRFGYEDVTTK